MKINASRKPEIADINKLSAERNILCKLNILEAWAKNGIPPIQTINSGIDKNLAGLEYFPRSIRQFNFWDGSQNSLQLREGIPAIFRNANETLNSHKELRLRVAAVLEALVIKSLSQANQLKPLRIKKLNTSLELERKLRSVAETELIVLRENMRLLQRQISESQSSSVSIEREFQRLVKSLEGELEDTKAELATLKAKLAKVVPLKRVK
ncbi:hypothetical protein [Methylophilus sp. 3sh_L]|uniref:hypothetical protein n=1 Tax=Methylophilus sp. 3sh_L TaxID=3377114 RepID=UPI00398EDC45